MNKFFAVLICTFITLESHALTPRLNINQEIDFGEVMFVPGNCTMNHQTGAFTLTNPAGKCGGYGNGTPARYVIIANPNKQVRIKLLQRTNSGDGYLFIPAGEIISDTETLSITPDIAQDIDSGTSGIIQINMGGSLYWSLPIAPGINVDFTREDGIEWSELP